MSWGTRRSPTLGGTSSATVPFGIGGEVLPEIAHTRHFSGSSSAATMPGTA